MTETVAETTLVDEIFLDGFFVRDEQIVSGGGNGVMKCNYEDGQRVRQGSVLSSVFQSQQDQINLQLIDEYTKEFEQLDTLSGEGAVKGSRIDIIVKQVSQLQLEYVAQIEAGSFSKAKELKDSLTYQLNKLQLCKGESENYDGAMAKLQGKIDSLRSSSETMGSITAPAGGYFSGKTDGLEQSLGLKESKKMSVSEAEKVLETKIPVSDGIGKIVTSNYWYYCALAQSSDLTKRLNIGDTVMVKFGSLSSAEYALRLVEKKEEADQTLFVFQSSVMNKKFINARFEKASITVASYEGIGVNKKALRFQDGVKGVYIARGTNVLFRKLDPVYEDEDIIISRFTTDAAYVSVYDNVVIGGESIGGSG